MNRRAGSHRHAPTARAADVAEVVRVAVERRELTAAAVPALRELFGLDRLPLAPARVTVELRGVPTAFVNALRRVVMDEMPGHALRVPADGFDAALTTELFMLPQFVGLRIALIPLRPQIPPEVVSDLRLQLDVSNPGAAPRAVYAGDLEVAAGAMREPLFNPTFKLCTLEPGKRIVIRGIHIGTDYGREDGAYNVARRGAYRHLDVPQHTDREMRSGADGGARDADGRLVADLSGYRVSSLRADPRHHALSAVLPATTADPAEARAVFADACGVIKGRLRLVLATIGRRPEADAGAQYSVVQLGGGLSEGIVQVAGETHTIGELLRRAVYDRAPDVANVSYHILSHENRLWFSVRHTGDVTAILLGAIGAAIDAFDAIQRGIAAAH